MEMMAGGTEMKADLRIPELDKTNESPNVVDPIIWIGRNR